MESCCRTLTKLSYSENRAPANLESLCQRKKKYDDPFNTNDTECCLPDGNLPPGYRSLVWTTRPWRWRKRRRYEPRWWHESPITIDESPVTIDGTLAIDEQTIDQQTIHESAIIALDQSAFVALDQSAIIALDQSAFIALDQPTIIALDQPAFIALDQSAFTTRPTVNGAAIDSAIDRSTFDRTSFR